MRWVQFNKKWIQSQLKDLCDDLDDDHYSDPEFFAIFNGLVGKLYKEYDLWLRFKSDNISSSPIPTKPSLWKSILRFFSHQKLAE